MLLLQSLIRFHWAAGARVALRANALTLGIVVFAFGYAPDALDTLRRFVFRVVTMTGHNDGGPRMLLAAIAAALAVTAVPRVSLGGAGWMRSLPVDRRASWRAAVVAASAAQIAVVAFTIIGAAASAVAFHAPISLAKVATVPLIMVGVAMVVVPARNPLGRIIAAIAVLSAISGTWTFGTASLALLTVADVVADGLPVRKRRWRARRPTNMSGGSSGMWIWIRLTWRAIGMRRMIDSMLVPTVATAYAYFITRNNPEFARHTNTTVITVCGGVAVATFAAGMANAVFVGRQPWAWSRSLAWSSTARVTTDALAIGLPIFLIPIALLPLGIVSALVVAASIPLAAAAGAAALRGVGARQTGAAGETFVLALVASVVVGIWPMLAVVALGFTPLIIRWGATRERAWHVARWTELHHNAAGDPTWLTAP